MTPEFAQALFVLAIIWALAVTVKAFTLSQRGEGYLFGMWDGGMIRAGKRLKLGPTKLKGVFSIVIATLAGLTVSRTIEPRMGSYVLIGVLVVSLINDFAGAE